MTHQAHPPDQPYPPYFCSIVTVTGDMMRTVIASPGDGRRAAVAGHHGAGSSRCSRGRADRRTFGAAEDRAEDRAADRRPADLGGALVARRGAVTIERFRRDRQTRAVGEDQRVEADAEPRGLLELAAAFDLYDRAEGAGAGGNRHRVADADVARDACFHTILDARTIARHRGVGREPMTESADTTSSSNVFCGGSGARGEDPVARSDRPVAAHCVLASAGGMLGTAAGVDGGGALVAAPDGHVRSSVGSASAFFADFFGESFCGAGAGRAARADA